MSSVTRCIALLGAVASFATARAVTEANAKATSAGFNTTRYNCTKELCPFSYTPVGQYAVETCGEVNAAPRMPDDIWDDANAVQEYVAATINFYSVATTDPYAPKVKLINSLCDHTGGRVSNKTQSVPWTSPDLMKYTCGAVCGCSYPACPDVPDDPRNHKYCSLCGPKFNQPIDVTFWAVNIRTQQWSFTTPVQPGNLQGSYDVTPAVSPDGCTIFVGGYVTSLYAVATAESKRPTGVPYWTFTTGDTPYGSGATTSPVVSPDGKTVYVGAADGHLYAVATADGTQRWKFATNDGFVNVGASPTVSADSSTVYVSRNSIGFVAINAADGKPRWELPLSIDTTKHAGRSVLSPDGGTVYLMLDNSTLGGNFQAIDTASGKRRWSIPCDSCNIPAVSPDGNTVYAGSAAGADSGGFYAINAADGTPRWTYTAVGIPLHYSWSIPTVSPNGDTVYVDHDSDSFHAINAADGTPRWDVPTSVLLDFATPVLSQDGSTVYVLLNERLAALDTTYGTTQWEFLAGPGYFSLTSSVALSPDGRTVYVGSAEVNQPAVVYALLTAPPSPPTPAKIER